MEDTFSELKYFTQVFVDQFSNSAELAFIQKKNKLDCANTISSKEKTLKTFLFVPQELNARDFFE